MKNYLIIGGSSGIGKEIINILINKINSKVYASYNQNPKDNNENIEFFKLNVLKDEIDTSILPDIIDGLVYCPGYINLKPFHRFKEVDFLNDYQLQVLGAIKVIQSVLPNLNRSTNASIVLFSTIAVKRGFNFHSLVSTSKGAIEGLTKSLSAEFAPNIRVNAVAPSLTDTNLSNKFLNTKEKINIHSEKNPLKKIGKASDIAEAVTYLLTNKSSWVTGQILHVDGGQSTIIQ
jgi:NAD(P)-dependent dehydrogenase (short-subunit alcohol dehydrogenase family)